MGYGEVLKFHRLNNNLTQEELGASIGVTGVTIMRYEKGTRKIPNEVITKLIPCLGEDFLIDIVNEAYTKENIIKDYFENIKSTSISIENVEISNLLSKLNTKGKQEAVKRVEELTRLPEYTEETTEEKNKPSETD